MKNILIIGAHYDDAELGVGGTAARFVAENKKVYKITLTNTQVKSSIMSLDIKAERAQENSRNACLCYGAVEIPFHTAPYGELTYSRTMMQELEKIINEYDIDTCFFHFKSDYNTDHLSAHRICMTAARHCNNLLMYQSNPYITSEAFYPNVFFDISDYVHLKEKALSCYDAEHNRQGNLFESNIERNRLWGYGIHTKCAEGFMAIKFSL
ncbi:MAG: PIG-L family deacetylase [Clostridia bacterium]|nr:PIG-L family deacetylase [Clostridia bacterium]